MKKAEFIQALDNHDGFAEVKNKLAAAGLDPQTEVDAVVNKQWFLKLLKAVGLEFCQLAIQIIIAALTRKLNLVASKQV